MFISPQPDVQLKWSLDRKYSILNRKVIYIEKSELNIADMWLIPCDHITYTSYSKLSKELKNGIKMAKQFLSYLSNIILTALIHNLKTVWPTKISMPFLSSLENVEKLLIILRWHTKHANFKLGVQYPLKISALLLKTILGKDGAIWVVCY